MTVADDGEIQDFVVGRPAYIAGLAPGMYILSVNGRPWSPVALREAIAASPHAKSPLEITARNNDSVRTFRLLYQGGLRFPHLVHLPDKPDLLDQILKQHAPPVR
jgi:predicted metalloprotease with PDZ domain